jgi:anti-sigma regulatory factor (Ser/Thr protein kinase)
MHHREVAGQRSSDTVAPHRVRLATDPARVPEARRFVVDRVSALGYPDLTDDAALCVSELATNAALHSRGEVMEVVLEALDGGVRIVVEDEGATPVDALAPRHHYGPEGPAVAVEDPLTSGRGLAIVACLAAAWGVDETVAGKRVWAVLEQTG